MDTIKPGDIVVWVHDLDRPKVAYKIGEITRSDCSDARIFCSWIDNEGAHHTEAYPPSELSKVDS